jgi:hypothetical protein
MHRVTKRLMKNSYTVLYVKCKYCLIELQQTWIMCKRIDRLTQVWILLGLPIMSELLKNMVQKVRCVNNYYNSN